MYLKEENEKFLFFLREVWSYLTGIISNEVFHLPLGYVSHSVTATRLRVGFDSETTVPGQFVLDNFQSWEILGRISEILRNN